MHICCAIHPQWQHHCRNYLQFQKWGIGYTPLMKRWCHHWQSMSYWFHTHVILSRVVRILHGVKNWKFCKHNLQILRTLSWILRTFWSWFFHFKIVSGIAFWLHLLIHFRDIACGLWISNSCQQWTLIVRQNNVAGVTKQFSAILIHLCCFASSTDINSMWLCSVCLFNTLIHSNDLVNFK